MSASGDKTIKIWDVDSRRCIKTLEGQISGAISVAFSDDGKYIVSASSDETIKLWEFKPLQEIANETRERFKDVPLTAQERREYYIE